MDLRDAIHRIALEWPSYGRPRITAGLRKRGWKVNPKRVQRLLREDNLLRVRKRKFVVTTDSNHHGRKIYPNLACAVVLTNVDQLWRADITHMRATRVVGVGARRQQRRGGSREPARSITVHTENKAQASRAAVVVCASSPHRARDCLCSGAVRVRRLRRGHFMSAAHRQEQRKQPSFRSWRAVAE